ncbi:hypothetical protein Tco_1560031 [Tanacetum coccineum]
MSARTNMQTTRTNILLASINIYPTSFNVQDHPLKHMEHRGIFDSGCSGHMTGNRAHLEDYQELSKVGYVTFGGSKAVLQLIKKIKKLENKLRQKRKREETERMNRTLIEAARTMLADSHLPTTFWAYDKDKKHLFGRSWLIKIH